MAATLILLYGFLAIILTVMIVQLFPSDCSVSMRTEGFQNQMTPQTSCPPGTKSFLNEQGDMMCCKGDVNGRKCEGSIVCSFSSTTKDIPFCGTLPVTPSLFDSLLNPPERKVSVSSEEIAAGSLFFQNTMAMLYFFYLDLLLRNSPSNEVNQLKTLYKDTVNWRNLYAAKSDNTVLAKEAKYRINALYETPFMKSQRRPEKDKENTLAMLLRNDSPLMSFVKSLTPVYENDLKQRKIQY